MTGDLDRGGQQPTTSGQPGLPGSAPHEVPDPPIAVLPIDPSSPPQVDGIQLVGRIGAGGMADAYLGWAVGRWVVVKSPPAPVADETRARLRREVEAMRRIHSPLVAEVVAARIDQLHPWFAVEYVPGPTIAQHIAAHGRLDPEETAMFARGLAQCIAAVQGAAVVHRDLKPDNVVLSPDGPRLIDFGTAELPDATSLTMVGQMVGTLAWMAPEQIAGEEVTPATDIHAWGLLVTHVALGEVPFQADSAVTAMYRALHETPKVPDSLPGPLSGLVARAVSKDPARRPTVTDILELLGPGPVGPVPAGLATGRPAPEGASPSTGAMTPPVPTPPATAGASTRHSEGSVGSARASVGAPQASSRWKIIALIAAAVALVAVGAWLLPRGADDPNPPDPGVVSSESPAQPTSTPTRTTPGQPGPTTRPTTVPTTAPTSAAPTLSPTDQGTTSSTPPPTDPTPQPTTQEPTTAPEPTDTGQAAAGGQVGATAPVGTGTP